MHATILEKSQFPDSKVLMPFDRTVEIYHFYMRYKALIPRQAEWGDELPTQFSQLFCFGCVPDIFNSRSLFTQKTST